jgi:hypothetical protein
MMRTHARPLLSGTAIAFISAFACGVQPASAQQESSMLITPPANAAPAHISAESVPPVVVVSNPCIEYKAGHRARKMLSGETSVPVMMSVDNPADRSRCVVDVPMCVPACCQGEPKMTSDCGLLGRGSVAYCWPCGFTATVVFRANGEIVVHYSV